MDFIVTGSISPFARPETVKQILIGFDVSRGTVLETTVISIA